MASATSPGRVGIAKIVANGEPRSGRLGVFDKNIYTATIARTSAFTRTNQKFLSFALSSLWKLRPGLAGFIWRSKAVVFTSFCSSPVRRARLSVKVSAMRKSTVLLGQVFRV